MSSFQLVATKLSMLNKEGRNTPDKDGYYTLVVGGLNIANNTGAWHYTAEGARELFSTRGVVQRRVANGTLLAEVGHPHQMPGETDDAFYQRFIDINQKNACAHFRKIWLDEEYGRKNPVYKNPGLIAIMAEVKPVEPYGHILKDALDNPHRNVCFSIRAFADEFIAGGKVVRILKDVITFDFVTEGGVTMASKWDSPATESIDNSELILPVTKKIIQQVAEDSKHHSYATESSREISKLLITRHMHESKVPVYGRW